MTSFFSFQMETDLLNAEEPDPDPRLWDFSDLLEDTSWSSSTASRPAKRPRVEDDQRNVAANTAFDPMDVVLEPHASYDLCSSCDLELSPPFLSFTLLVDPLSNFE